MMTQSQQGVFIAFEGAEGAGKTTQISRLAARLEQARHRVCVTREPGGTPGGEALRSVLLDPGSAWSPWAEALLMNAARDAHLREVILPALSRGEVVLTDRFALSTRAYQGGGGELPGEAIDFLEKQTCPRLPDLTLVFQIDVAEGLARAAARGRADRFEAKGEAYHAHVANAFGEAAQRDDHAAIDATGTIEEVSARVEEAVRARLPNLLRADA